jgi:hypothetical protein
MKLGLVHSMHKYNFLSDQALILLFIKKFSKYKYFSALGNTFQG